MLLNIRISFVFGHGSVFVILVNNCIRDGPWALGRGDFDVFVAGDFDVFVAAEHRLQAVQYSSAALS